MAAWGEQRRREMAGIGYILGTVLTEPVGLVEGLGFSR